MPETLIVGLAAYRLAKLITMEDGPLDLALKFREWIFGRFNETTWINKGLSCPFCVSFWLALFLALLVTRHPSTLLLMWLAGAGVASIIFHWEFK